MSNAFLGCGFGLVLLLGAACNDDPPASGNGQDAGLDTNSDAAADANTLPRTCVDTCRTTKLTVRKGELEKSLDRAQYGLESNEDGLYVQAYKGGDPKCPEEDSPQTEITLVLGTPMPSLPEAFSQEQLTVAFFDFVGDLVEGVVPPKATRVSLTPVAANLEGGVPFVAFDLEAELETGITLEGHIFAEHCTSLDGK